MIRFAKLSMAAFALVAGSIASYADTQADVAAGKVLYVDNCVKCHGTKGQGGIGLKLKGDAAYWAADVFNRAVLTGINDEGHPLKKPMPVFGTVGLTLPKGQIPTESDLANIQAYLQTFGPEGTD